MTLNSMPFRVMVIKEKSYYCFPKCSMQKKKCINSHIFVVDEKNALAESDVKLNAT